MQNSNTLPGIELSIFHMKDESLTAVLNYRMLYCSIATTLNITMQSAV